MINKTINNSKRLALVITLLISVASHANLSKQQNETLTNETFTCTLYQEATQYSNSEHSESLHCQDKKGLSYELLGPTAELNNRFLITNKAIDKKLSESIVQMTKLNNTQSSKLYSAKTRLRQQLNQAAQPQLTLKHFIWQADKIILTDQSDWSVFWDEKTINIKLDALNVTEKSTLLAAYEGFAERTTLVFHITANDFSTTATPAALGDSVFGTNGDSVNLVSQYAACSYGQKIMIPAQGQHITDGVVELTIDMNVEGESRGTVRNAAITAANELFGNLYSKADHFMFALPPNTDGGWIAYASINGSISTYNNKWATYVSAQMHELGHNFGMGHSGIGSNEYGDKSGMMGYSYSSNNGPKMCFNADKSSKFGWYSDKELTFYESNWSNNQGPWSGKFIGVANYNQAATDQYLLAKIHSIEGDESSYSLKLNFNRQTGINSGTKTGKNRLLVTSIDRPNGYNESFLEANLDIGETKTFVGFWPSGRDLVITVNDIATDNNGLMYADIEIDDALNIVDLIFNGGFEG